MSALTEPTSGESTTVNYPYFTPSSSIHNTKLTRQNYYLWRTQILPYLGGRGRGQGVYGEAKNERRGGAVQAKRNSTMDDSFEMVQSELPADIMLLEVLTRIPLRKAFQFTCVSTIWRSRILSPVFYEIYRSLNPRAIVISVSDDSEHAYYYSVLKHRCSDDHQALPHEFVNSLNLKHAIRITETVNGMICACNNDSNNISSLSLLNVRSGETIMALPHPGKGVSKRLAHYFLGFEPVSGVYKLLKIGKPIEYFFSRTANSSSYDCEILTLSRNTTINNDIMCWRKLPKTSAPVVFGIRFRCDLPYLDTQSFTVNGFLFWLIDTSPRSKDGYIKRLFSFDFTEEKFRSIAPPKDSPDIFKHSNLTQFRSRLALFDNPQSQPPLISIYTLDDKEGFAWTKHILTLPCGMAPELSYDNKKCIILPVGNLLAGEILFVVLGTDDPYSTPVYSYNYTNGLFERFLVGKLPKCVVREDDHKTVRFTADDGFRCC